MEQRISELQEQRQQALFQFYAAQTALDNAKSVIESTTNQLKLLKEMAENNGDQ